MKFSMPKFQIIAVIVGLLFLGFIFFWVVKEGFRSDPRDPPESTSMADECGARSSCSSCLEPLRDIFSEAKTEEDCTEKKGGTVRRDKDGKYAKCMKLGTCGWCKSASNGAGKPPGKCVPRTESGAPVVPLDSATNQPAFTCPVEIGSELNFVARKEDCDDFQCDSLTNCRDCSQAVKCGWVVSEKKCYARTTTGKTFIPNSQSCPVPLCKDISGCIPCATTQNCGYCPLTKKCLALSLQGEQAKLLALNLPSTTTIPIEKCEKTVKISGKEDIQTSQPIISPSQCDATSGLPSYSELSEYEPSESQLSSIQTNMALGGDAGVGPATQNIPDTGGAVSAPKKSDTVSAPGVSRPLGSSGETTSFPAAVNLGTDKPFENYIQMLVRSELASQGVPMNEPFQVGNVVQNATGYFRKEGAKLAED
jgi:hypothetical protein